MSDMDDFFQDSRNADSLIVAKEVCGCALKKIAATEYAGPCPSCGGRDRFSINICKKTFNCRRCGAKGSNVDLAMLAFGCAAVEAAEKVNGRPRPNGSRDETEEERADRLAKNAQRQADNQRREEEQRRIEAAKTKRDEEAIDAVLERALDLDNPLAAHGKAYLQARNLNPDKRLIGDIKFVPDLDYWGARENGSGEIVRLATLPAIVATIRDSNGAKMGLSQVWLDPVEPRKWKPIGSPQNSARKIKGEKQHGMIFLGRRGERLAIGEGWETCLSWDQLRGMGFFGDTLAGEDITIAAAIDLGNLSGGATGSVDHPTLKRANGKSRQIPNGVPDPNAPGWVVPKGVSEVWLLGDYDSEVFATAAKMAVATRRVMDMGVEVHVHFPPTPGVDWNDRLLKGEHGALTPPELLPANATYVQKVAAFRHPIRMETGAEFLARVNFLFDPPKALDPGKPNFRSLAEFINEFRPISYAVAGLMREGSLYTFTGRTGEGKTAFLVMLALAVATGRGELIGRKVKQGRVAYATAENPDDLRMRLMIACFVFHIDPAIIDHDLIISDNRVRPEEINDWLKGTGEPFTLVIIDTWQAYFDGNNSNIPAEAVSFTRRFRPIAAIAGAPVVVIAAHPIKNASDDSLIPYGGGSTLNEVDGNFTILRDESALYSFHWLGKIRGLPFDPLHFKIDKFDSPDVVTIEGAHASHVPDRGGSRRGAQDGDRQQGHSFVGGAR